MIGMAAETSAATGTRRGSAQSRLTRLRRVTAVDDVGGGAPITGLSHVQLLVSDVGASAKWYSAVLGLAPYADDADGYVALRHKAGKFVVVLTKAPPRTGRSRRHTVWTILRSPCPTAPNWRLGPDT